jgi:hypothetical protein
LIFFIDFFLVERMRSAAAVVAALSRPASQKSGAWSKEDPEAGQTAEQEAAKKKKAAKRKKKKAELEAILEEEMEDDKAGGPEPIGCWTKVTSTISSKQTLERSFKK